MRFAKGGVASVAIGLVGLAVWVTPAAATFHLMVVREIYPGSAANSQAEYVELQAYASGQNFVEGHRVVFYDAAGASTGSAAFPQDVSNGQNQGTFLVGTGLESRFSVSPDATMAPDQLDPAGGAVCWETIDCVSWGSFAGTLPSPAGSPAAPAGIPDGMALRRTIAPGCPTLLEAGDDSDDSASDFSAVFPGPRPNSVAPSEHACTAPASTPGAGANGGAPQTTLKRHPPKRTRDRTPTFRFTSDQAGASFQCRLDGRPFRACRSPFTTRRLSLGRHVFRVRARNSSGQLDPSPAPYAFRVIARR